MGECQKLSLYSNVPFPTTNNIPLKFLGFRQLLSEHYITWRFNDFPGKTTLSKHQN